jgi:hypothetical protein
MDPIEAENDLNAAQKLNAEIVHTENLSEDKRVVPSLSKKQAWRFKLKTDFHVLPVSCFHHF